MRVPLVSIAMSPHSPSDADKMASGLAALCAEDPTLSIRSSPSGEVILGAIGELQLEVALARLAREFEVAAAVGRLQVGYTETVTREADGEMKLSMPGHYAHVKLTVYPRERGGGYAFENLLMPRAIPTEYVPGVEAGIQEALDEGILAGHPMQDVKVVLYDGSWHDVDSSLASFHIAARLAVRHALKRANPIVLEPLVRVFVYTPAALKDTVLESLGGRRVQAVDAVQHDGTLMLSLRAPVAAMIGYASDLRSRTRGLASFRMSFDGYEPLQPADDDGVHGVREPLHPHPIPRSGSIALPLDEM